MYSASGRAGEHATYSKYPQPYKHSAFVLDEDDAYKWLVPAVAAQQDVSADGPRTVLRLSGSYASGALLN
jgi:hypothetical protein